MIDRITNALPNLIVGRNILEKRLDAYKLYTRLSVIFDTKELDRYIKALDKLGIHDVLDVEKFYWRSHEYGCFGKVDFNYNNTVITYETDNSRSRWIYTLPNNIDLDKLIESEVDKTITIKHTV